MIGGIKLLDRGEADDKISAYSKAISLGSRQGHLAVAPVLVERLEHYFSTYKMVPGEPNKMVISGKYGFEHAKAVIEASREDYLECFGDAHAERRK